VRGHVTSQINEIFITSLYVALVTQRHSKALSKALQCTSIGVQALVKALKGTQRHCQRYFSVQAMVYNIGVQALVKVRAGEEVRVRIRVKIMITIYLLTYDVMLNVQRVPPFLFD
jgi:hypothetical protein